MLLARAQWVTPRKTRQLLLPLLRHWRRRVYLVWPSRLQRPLQVHLASLLTHRIRATWIVLMSRAELPRFDQPPPLPPCSRLPMLKQRMSSIARAIQRRSLVAHDDETGTHPEEQFASFKRVLLQVRWITILVKTPIAMYTLMKKPRRPNQWICCPCRRPAARRLGTAVVDSSLQMQTICLEFRQRRRRPHVNKRMRLLEDPPPLLKHDETNALVGIVAPVLAVDRTHSPPASALLQMPPRHLHLHRPPHLPIPPLHLNNHQLLLHTRLHPAPHPSLLQARRNKPPYSIQPRFSPTKIFCTPRTWNSTYHQATSKPSMAPKRKMTTGNVKACAPPTH